MGAAAVFAIGIQTNGRNGAKIILEKIKALGAKVVFHDEEYVNGELTFQDQKLTFLFAEETGYEYPGNITHNVLMVGHFCEDTEELAASALKINAILELQKALNGTILKRGAKAFCSVYTI